MPKINKKTIKTYKTYPTLKIFKYENSDVYHFVMYVGTILKEINNKKVMSGNFGHSLKERILRPAEQQAKELYKDIVDKINSGELKSGQKSEYNFDKDIVDRYFDYREKDYQANNRSMSNLRKEKSQYYNYCSEFFINIDYNDDVVMEHSIYDLVNYLKQTRKDTTITKYMNIISQVCKFGQRKGLNIGGFPLPLFIIGTDVKKNIIYVGQGEDHPGLYRNGLTVNKENIHWIREDLKIDIDTPTVYDSRIRYRQKLTPCSITSNKFGLIVNFKEIQRGITPGQFISWYKNDELIGSGIIN